MNTNSVKTGLLDQRNRATQRRRKRRSPIQDEPTAVLDTWLKNYSLEDSDLGRIDLVDFLVETQHIDIDPEERLHQLAISLELRASSLPGQSGWYALKRIYEYALRLNDRDEHIWLSMGISAQLVAENQENEASKLKLYKEKEFATLNALDISPNWAQAYYSLGYLYYFQSRKDEARKEFEQALSCENDHKIHSWAQLYIAHCLHDDKQWKKALDAYLLVDLSAFTGETAWRVDVYREQITECTLNMGNKRRAEKMLLEILDRYDAEPVIANYAMSFSLWRVAESLSPEYVERVEKIDQRAFNLICSSFKLI